MDVYEIKEALREVRDMTDEVLPSSRAKALVLTKLDEALLWLGEVNE